jgi:hypothetical protein
MDNQKDKLTRDLTEYYDYAKNTLRKDGGAGGHTYEDDEFYTDPTYTRTLAQRVLNLYYEAKE